MSGMPVMIIRMTVKKEGRNDFPFRHGSLFLTAVCAAIRQGVGQEPVKDSDPPDAYRLAASTTVSAVMLTMRRTVAVGVMTCTGRAAPSRTGPMVMPSAPVILSRL